MDYSTKKGMVGCLVIILAAIVFGVMWIATSCDNNMRYDTMEPFFSSLNEYAKAGAEGETSLPEQIKLVVLTDDPGSNSGYRVDIDEFLKFPQEMRAKTPDEVNTLVRLSYIYESVGVYTDGATAYRIGIGVTVINMENGIIWIKGKRFTGSMPPKSKTKNEYEAVKGSSPINEVIDFIKNSQGAPQPEG